MGVMKRVSQIFKARANAQLDRLEDPGETLDLAYEQLVQNVTKAEASVAEVATAHRQLVAQDEQLAARQVGLERQAQQAVLHDRDDLAREALARSAAIAAEREALAPQLAELAATREKLEAALGRLRAKRDKFDTHRQVLKATYTAAEATARANEVFTGIGEETGDLGLAVRRAGTVNKYV
jgi:phage shock protein A